MTLYSITAPNGVTYQTEGPPNATPEQIKRVILAAHPEAAVPKQEENLLEKIPVVGGVLAGAADLPLGIVEGLAGTGKTFTDVFGADNAASRFLGGIAEGAADWKSSGYKEDAAINAADQAQAEGKGTWEEVKAAGRSFMRSPLDTTASVLGSAIPFVAAAVATEGVSVPLMLGAASGAGMIKGDIYDAVYKASIEHGASEADAKAAAEKAQEYGGENTDQIALGTAIGAAAAATGLPRQISTIIGRKAAAEIIENTAAREVAEQVGRKSVLKGMAKGAVEEFVPEGLQAAQERYAQNKALRRQGYDVDQWAGVAGQGVFEGIASIIPGMAGGRAKTIAENRKATARVIEEEFNALPENPDPETLDKVASRFVARGIPEDVAQRVVTKIAAEKAALKEQAEQREAMRKAAIEQRTEGVAPSPEPDITAPMPAMGEELTPPPVEPEEEAARQRFYGGEEEQASGIAPGPKPKPKPMDLESDLAVYGKMTASGQFAPTPLVDSIASRLIDLSTSGGLDSIASGRLGPIVQQFFANEAATLNDVATKKAAPTQQAQTSNRPITPEQAAAILDSEVAIWRFMEQMGGIDEEDAIDRLQEWSGIRYSRRGRPPKDLRAQAEQAGQESLFGEPLPTQAAPSEALKRDEFNEFRFAPEEQKAELLRQQEEQMASMQERVGDAKRSSQEMQARKLDEIQQAIRNANPANDAYSVVFQPESKKPFRVVGPDGELFVSEDNLADFEESAFDLLPYVPPAGLSGQTVESADPTEPTVATSMIQQFVQEVDAARQAGQIDNNQRAQLLGRLERPNAYRNVNGVDKPNDAIAKLEAEAIKATEAFRNAENAEERAAAEQQLNEVNGRLTAAVKNSLLNPIRATLKSMVETRSDERLGATVRIREALRALAKRVVIVVHGGSDFDVLDKRKLGTGEPGGIRPLGNGFYGYVVDKDNAAQVEDAVAGARRYSEKYGRGEKAIHAFRLDMTDAETKTVGKVPASLIGTKTAAKDKFVAALEAADKNPSFLAGIRDERLAREAYINSVDLVVERLPGGLVEGAVNDLNRLERVGKIGVDKNNEELVKAVKEALAEGVTEERAARTELRNARIDKKETEAPKRATDRTEASEEEIQRVNDNLQGKSASDALQWLAVNGPDPLYRAVANRVLATMRKLEQLGQKFELHIITPDSLRPDLEGGSDFAGVAIDSSYAYELSKPGSTERRGVREGTNDIWLRGTEFGELTGTTFSTALHEFIHSVTQRAISAVEQGRVPGSTPMARAVKDLEAVFAAFKRHMDTVRDSTRLIDMTDVEWAYFNEANNFGQDIHEFIAWGLSDLEVQKYLMTIPYKRRGTLWTKLVDAMRKLFGVSEADGSMLAGLLEASEGLLSSPFSNFANAFDLSSSKIRTGAEEQLPLFSRRGKPKVSKETAEDLEDMDADISEGLRRTQKSVTSNGVASGIGEAIKARDFNAILQGFKDNYEGMSPAALKATLRSFPTSGILNWFKSDIPSLAEIDQLVSRMSNMKMNIIKAADPIAKELDEFMLRDKGQLLAQTMSTSRINSYAPDSFKTLDEALQNEAVLKEVESRILRNANDVKLAQKLIDDIKALAVARKSMVAAKGDKTKPSPALRALTNQLYKDAKDNSKVSQQVKQLVERTGHIRDGHMLWDNLAKVSGGHKLYKEIRAFYKDMFEAELALLDARIESLVDDTQAKRLRDLRADMMRTAASPEEAKKRGDTFYDIPGELFTKDYFPFMRQGNYYLVVKGAKDGTREREFYQRDSAKERNRVLAAVAKRLGVSKDDGDVFAWGNDISEMQKDLASEDLMMQQVFDLVGKTKAKMETEGIIGSRDVNDLVDSIYQTWLMSTPERSVRRRFLHAEEVVGFQQDILRQFSSQVTSYANQLSKMAFASDIRTKVGQARDSLEGRPPADKAKLNTVINEMAERSEQEINPDPQSAVINVMNRASYFYYLTSAATALINLTSIPIRVLPRMWRDYGFGNAAATYTKYMNLYKTLGNTRVEPVVGGRVDQLQAIIPDLRGSKYINAQTPRGELLRRAMKAGNELNVLETITDTLIQNEREVAKKHREGVTRTAAEVAAGTAKVMGVAFNAMENISRQAAYFMNFELAYDSFKAKNPQASEDEAFDHAVSKAVSAVRDTLGDYSNWERPRIAKNNLTRALFLFKMYPIIQTKFLVGAVRDIVRGVYGHGKKLMGSGPVAPDVNEAMAGALKELTGVTLMAGVFGGLAGMPLYSLLALALSQSFDDDDDEDVKKLMGLDVKVAYDSDIMFRKWMAEKFGSPTLGGVPLSDILVHGPVGALTDTELSSRVSFDLKDMWFREAVAGDSWSSTAIKTALANIAGGQMAVSMVDGANALADGDIYGGLKKMLPAFFRSFVTAAQGEEEGVTTRRGDAIIKPEDITTVDTLRSLAGFRSLRLSRLQDYAITRAKNEKKINSERQSIFDEFNKKRMKGEFESVEDFREFWKERILPFNRTYPDPDFVITMESLMRSAKGREEVAGRTVQGMQLSKKTAQRDLKMAEPFLIK